MAQLDTPVALLTFNRPEETAQVLDAVRAARPRRLLVVGDGPRSDRRGEDEVVARTRAVVADIDWPCEVSYEYADENMGCGARVSSGLDWVFETVHEAIVLEDDCLPTLAFFRFAEAMLGRFRDDERIGMIAGTNYFSDLGRLESYFFTNYFAIWGWATWARAWRSYDRTMREWPAMRARRDLYGVFRDSGLAAYVTAMFDLGYSGEIDTWDFQWAYSCLTQRRMSVVPRVNLVTNIGYVGTRPSGPNLSMATFDLDAKEIVSPTMIVPDLAYEDRLFAEKLRTSLPRRVQDGALRAGSRARSALSRRAGRP